MVKVAFSISGQNIGLSKTIKNEFLMAFKVIDDSYIKLYIKTAKIGDYVRYRYELRSQV